MHQFNLCGTGGCGKGESPLGGRGLSNRYGGCIDGDYLKAVVTSVTNIY
jgi:hypothetical protein